MKHHHARLLSLAGLLAIGALAGCAGSPSNPTPLAPVQQTAPMQAFGDLASPDVCGKSSKQKVSSKGGAFVLPPCGGYKGTISYGSNNAPANTTVTLVTSTKNPGGVPTPSKGTVLAFVQATGSSTAGSVTFGNTSTKSSIKNATKLKSTDTYYLYAYALGIPVQGFPQNIGSPTNGVLTFTSPLDGQTVPQGITIDFELVQN